VNCRLRKGNHSRGKEKGKKRAVAGPSAKKRIERKDIEEEKRVEGIGGGGGKGFPNS